MSIPTYVDVDTTTPGKLNATTWAESRSRCGKGWCVYLVGSPLGLDRHINDKIRLGFQNLKKHIIVEHDQDTFVALREACAIKYPGVQVIKGDFREVCEQLGWAKIGHMDFDSVESFGEYSMGLLEQASFYGVPNLHLVNAGRYRQNAWLEQQCEALGLERQWKRSNQGHKVFGFPKLKELLPLLLNRLCFNRGYELSVLPYRGRCQNLPRRGGTPMLMLVLQKKTKWLTIDVSL